ncbi:MAG TPA: zf-HC2 domain-containing protein [Gemmataceae bacterium]|jgi:anti-sigma factor RsiW
MLGCQDFIAGMDAFVAKDLPPDRQAEYEAHLTVCKRCARAVADYQRVIDLARQLYDLPLPEGFLQRVREAIAEMEPEEEE